MSGENYLSMYLLPGGLKGEWTMLHSLPISAPKGLLHPCDEQSQDEVKV